LAKNPLIRQSAEDQGISVRSKNNPLTWKSNSEYHDYVATVAVAMERLDEIKENTDEATNNLQNTVQNVATKLTATEGKLQRNLAEQIGWGETVESIDRQDADVQA